MPKPRVSDQLTEVRTVHSRARSAIARFEYLRGRTQPQTLPSGYVMEAIPMTEPYEQEMMEALAQVVALLEPYSKESFLARGEYAPRR